MVWQNVVTSLAAGLLLIGIQQMFVLVRAVDRIGSLTDSMEKRLTRLERKVFGDA